jgi:hypothetical protein
MTISADSKLQSEDQTKTALTLLPERWDVKMKNSNLLLIYPAQIKNLIFAMIFLSKSMVDQQT